MIEITEGFTSITAGADAVAALWPDMGGSQTHCRRAPTGVRVTLEFSRAAALPSDEPVRALYDFGDGGAPREVVGIANPTHVEVRWGRAVVYHYRLSHWIAPGELAPIAADYERQRTEAAKMPRQDASIRGRLADEGECARGDLIPA
jgi:hypothetical protein